MHRHAVLPLTFPLLLAACLGGGGGDGGNNNTQPLDGQATPFTTFSAIGADELIEMESPEIDNGVGGLLALTVNYAANQDDIDGVDPDNGTLTQEPSQLRVLFDDQIDPIQARLNVTFPGDSREDLRTYFTGAPVELEQAVIDVGGPPIPTPVGNRDDYILFGNVDDEENETDLLAIYVPDDFEDVPEYMTFGLWGLGLQNASVDLGGAAWGNETPVNLMPNGGSATYQGGLLGTLISDEGAVTFVEATSLIAANFINGTVGMSSINSRDFETGADLSGLNIFNNGDAMIAGNTFVGGQIGLTGVGPNTLGNFGGAFYGPLAAEAGGWFSTDSVLGRYLGSFGGTQTVD